jgi:CheY-like chemotaxis protein
VLTVLIADDDADHRELLAITLRRFGHEVAEAVDAVSALRRISAGGLDAVLLDVRMPGGSGIELCRLLRGDPATATLPIMVISADVNDQRIRAARAAGADDYLAKPFDRAELGARLKDLLLRRPARTSSPVTAANAALLSARAALHQPATAPDGAAARRIA